MTARLSETWWWTAADDAELDQMLARFVDLVFDHRDDCAVCASGGPWCGDVRGVFDSILAWRAARIYASRAIALRLLQNEIEDEALRSKERS